MYICIGSVSGIYVCICYVSSKKEYTLQVQQGPKMMAQLSLRDRKVPFVIFPKQPCTG